MVYWCSLVHLHFIMLVFTDIFWLCFTCARKHLLAMFCWCLSAPFDYALLVFIVTSLLCSICARCYLLIVPCWHLLMPSYFRYLLTPNVHQCLLVVFFCCSLVPPYYVFKVLFGFLDHYFPLAFFFIGV